MKKAVVGITTVLCLVAAGSCSDDKAKDANAYSALPDGCALLDDAALTKYIGRRLAPKASTPPEIRPGDRQTVCRWGPDSTPGGGWMLLAANIESPRNDGIEGAISSFKRNRQISCGKDGAGCQQISNVGDDVYWVKEGSARGSAKIFLRDKNITVAIGWNVPMVSGSPGSATLQIGYTSISELAKLVVNRLRSAAI